MIKWYKALFKNNENTFGLRTHGVQHHEYTKWLERVEVCVLFCFLRHSLVAQADLKLIIFWPPPAWCEIAGM